LTLGLLGLVTATVSATPYAEIEIVPVSPRDVAAAPDDIFDEASAGLNVLAVGTKMYLEAVPTTTTVIGGYAWTIERRPYGSTAMPSPADAELTAFVPDVEGVYNVILTPLDGSLSPTEPVMQTVYAGTWIGNGVFNTHDTPDDSIPHCGNACCHKENANPRLNIVDEWLGSAHAHILTEVLGGLTNHYSVSCLECHTVGFDLKPEAANNGFDDVADMIGYDLNEIPILALDAYNTGTDHWPDLPAELQGHANIQCENCHGPGSQHLGNILAPDHGIGGPALDVGRCARCHDSGSHHVFPYQWARSAHPDSAEAAHSSSCVQCHTGEGFVAVTIDGKPASSVDYHDASGITCSACHDPHDSDFPHQLRTAGPATLPNDYVFENAGLGGLCMQCHNGRRADAEGDALTNRRGLHHGPQADMLAGQSAASFGLPFNGNSAHTTIVEDTCVDCHMAPQDTLTDDVGQHTFAMRNDMGTADPSDDIINAINACDICHPGLDAYDREARGDYDGDGAVDGIQTEVRGLLALLQSGIVSTLDSAAIVYEMDSHGYILVDSTSDYTSLPEDFRRALFNYNYVINDGSYGIHNTSFAVQLLQRSYYGVYGHSILDDYPDIDLRGPVQPSSLPPTPTPTPPPTPSPTPPPAPGNIEILGVSPRTVGLDETGIFDEVASGLNTVGKGTKVYLQAEANDAATTGFTWNVIQRPGGSLAQLIPHPGDLVTFRPDVEGIYVVELTSLSDGGPLAPTFQQKIYATKWASAGVFNTHAEVHPPPAVAPNCGTGYCHGSSAQPRLYILADWLKSKHSQKLQNHLKGVYGSHYSVSCLPCHTVGFNENPAADNAGFDDQARAIDYPTTTIPVLVEDAALNTKDNWPQLPGQLQNYASIQCESCHGAGTLHPSNIFTDPKHGIDGQNLGVEQCAQCHDSSSGHQQKVWQWSNSAHPAVEEHMSTNTGCVKCHTGEGFVDVQVNGYPAVIHHDAHGITCSSCHDPHYSKNPHQVRVSGDYTIPSGVSSYGAEVGGLCLRCHNSRVADGEDAALTNRRGVHHGTQGDMLLGSTGASFGLPFAASSPHGVVVPELCVTCHMAAPTESGSGIITPPKVGDHTFSMRDTMGTEDESDDVINVTNACTDCHLGLDTYDFPAGEDYDGDGTPEGVQTEVRGLLELLSPGIINQLDGSSTPYTIEDNGKIQVGDNTSYTALPEDLRRAIYNYNYVIEDGSFGVHNTHYAVQLLQRAYFGAYGRSILDDFPNIDLAGPVQEPGSGAGQPDLWMAR